MNQYNLLLCGLAMSTALVTGCQKDDPADVITSRSADEVEGAGLVSRGGNPSAKSHARNNTLYIDNAPTFLVGYFSSGSFGDDERFEMLRRMDWDGFNVMHSVDDYALDVPRYTAFLDEAERRGVNILHSL